MKTHILTLLLCCCGIMGFSQSVTNLEYFFNTDPGFGNATSITADTNTGSVTQTVSVPVNSLTGFNTLYIRSKDNLGKWSLYDKRIFYVTNATDVTGATKIASAEYFINTDPGFGNASPITVNSNTGELSQVLSLPIGNIQGFNTLYIRTKDDLGVWSMYDKRIFYVAESTAQSSATKIAAAEYFINTDPGFGNASPITVNANTGEITQVLSLPVGSLQGFNTLYIRTKDDLGKWSMYDKRLFYIRNETNLVIADITAAEYFYDTDPGFGNGTAATITPTAKPNEFTIELATTDISCGLQDFYIRLKNADGKWSLYDYKKGIEVYDNANPTIVVFPNITKELDAAGKASITITDVNNGSYDDCQLASVVLNQAKIDYTCANLGVNTVKVTATDAENKESNLDVTITVVDKIKPVAITKNITVQLDSSGKATIVPSQINNNSTDNCSITGYSLDVSSFTCSNLGSNTVNLTVTDSSGNTNTTSAIVTVADVIKPTVITKAISVQLDATGAVSITANDIDNNSSDNCSLSSITIDISSFSCAKLGENTVTLTATDQSGNTNSTTAIVTVLDVIKPSVLTKNISVQLDSSGQATITASQIENGSTDNCSIASYSLDTTNFTCNDLGNKTVTLSVTDTSGNIGTETAIVTVLDVIKPLAITKNISLSLDASGQAIISANDIDNSSTDNCGITSKSLDKVSFTCADLGANTVTLTVADLSGNTDSATATVTITDAVKPTVLTKNISVQLDSSGQATITASQIENGSTDNCSIANYGLDITNFTCNDLGNKTVTLSITDLSGNVGAKTAIVTVLDAINPAVFTKNFTIQLDASGKATITPNDIDNGSTDNCSIISKSLDKVNFTCANLGINTVMLTVTDSSGNANSATATVTITDALKPSVQTKNITVQLNSAGQASITASQIDNGSTDNCSIASNSLDITNFTCNDLGNKAVTLSVTDTSGNVGTETAIVTVLDAINPVAIAKNFTIQLDASGKATIIPNDIDNGSTDNCSITSKSLDKVNFTCANLGANTVLLTVTDSSGNANSTTATVTIKDAIKPTALGKNSTVYLNGNSSVTILPSDVDNGSYDNCNSISLSIDVNSFNSTGSYPVVLTVIDGYGNSSSTTVIVTVDDTLSINENKPIANQIHLFPVPTSEILNISTNLTINTIEVYDVSGRKVNTIYNPNTKIDTSRLPSGAYILKFYIEDDVVIKNILKQ